MFYIMYFHKCTCLFFDVMVCGTIIQSLHSLDTSVTFSESCLINVCHTLSLIEEICFSLAISESGVTELEDDEGLVDDAIKTGAIHFLRQSVVASETFHQEVRSHDIIL